VKISQIFTTLLKAQLFFSTASILVPFLLTPFNKSIHSCPVKFIFLPLKPLENAILQCLFVWVMEFSQTVFKMNKWGESDGARSELQGGCGKTVHPNFLTASAVWTLLRLGIFIKQQQF
jgi:hypothetical protein